MLKSTLAVLALLCYASVGGAEEEAPAYVFDEVNTPFENVIAKATAAKKPIFLDFYLDG